VESKQTKPLFEVEQDYARLATSSWIGRPDVRAVVEYVREAALASVQSLAAHMTGQVQLIRFCWRVCGIGAVYPDGHEEPNPFDQYGPEPWPLTDDERNAAGYYAAVFHRLVKGAAAELTARGVPIDAEWSGDQATLAVLILLHALDLGIPWDGPIERFADDLQPPGVSAFTPDGRSVSARDGRPDALARNADRIRKHLRKDRGGRELGVPYARGGSRALPRVTQIRRELLTEIIADNPKVTVTQILMTYDNSERTIGGRLRCRLAERLEAEELAVPDKPSESTLYADFQSIRRGPVPDAGGKVSG
jgi:hypothetical protein